MDNVFFRRFLLACGLAATLGVSAPAQAAAPAAQAAPGPGTLLQHVRAGDAERRQRIARVSERLFAAVAPLCRGYDIDCRPAVGFENGRGLNAHARAGRITVSRALVDLASDDQLALVIGHELAHLLLGHAGGGESAISLGGGSVRDEERQADHVGLYLVARAGFRPREAVDLWRRVAMTDPRLTAAGTVHPGLAERYRALRRTCMEIEAKQRAGRALVPG